MSRWIDVSVPLRDGMLHYPGDAEVRIRRVRRLEDGDTANVTDLSMSAHTGTHMDAPFHSIPGGHGIDLAPPEVLIGPARVFSLDTLGAIDAVHLERFDPRPGERLLLRTANSPSAWALAPRFVEDFAHLSTGGARFLADRRIALVGIDYLSIGEFHQGMDAHQALLEAGVWIVEGLDLTGVDPGEYDLVCLPLRLEGADGAPCRAMIRRREETPVPASGRI
jgi:arylformamidase